MLPFEMEGVKEKDMQLAEISVTQQCMSESSLVGLKDVKRMW
jgi:hypothetical protein